MGTPTETEPAPKLAKFGLQRKPLPVPVRQNAMLPKRRSFDDSTLSTPRTIYAEPSEMSERERQQAPVRATKKYFLGFCRSSEAEALEKQVEALTKENRDLRDENQRLKAEAAKSEVKMGCRFSLAEVPKREEGGTLRADEDGTAKERGKLPKGDTPGPHPAPETPEDATPIN